MPPSPLDTPNIDLSVVIPTLNAREQLTNNLDALAEHAPTAEVIVVNGPSADGTSGMVQNRTDVDVLIEVSERTLNVARNAGIIEATGEAIAILHHDLTVEPTWVDAIKSGLSRATVVTGPVHQMLSAGMTTTAREQTDIGGRTVTYFNGGNVAFTAATIEDIDGFDEYLETGGARDVAHRLAATNEHVAWEPKMCVRTEYETDGGTEGRDIGWKYRSLAYRLIKNYGIRPTVVRRTLAHIGCDAIDTIEDLLADDRTLSASLSVERDAVIGAVSGLITGLQARFADRSVTRNPNGCSARADRAVTRYDWR
ncbi:MAG: glycosyltransferases involved in cell wall biogenesis [Haloquadratum walsbyi J07HQW2]|uniref:Glycosyltransferases involved in cell wall biogenesis n=1 Tax=Haloquadratum walsbyi J07HQW2 TaxID=1238425 RepID=U1NHW5_9EURY|nr:MAG: glycosyltransferases involved in cell wall biogenesis [Haloquadratum walsbyi J07HQW2]